MNGSGSLMENCQSAFLSLQTGLPGREPPWLARARRRAMEGFTASGLPGRRDEAWKYTDITPLCGQGFHFRPQAIPADGSTLRRRVDALARQAGAGHSLVFVDGRYQPALSTVGRLPPGAFLGSLQAALAVMPERLEGPINRGAETATGFLALNAAFLEQGMVLFVPRNEEIQEDIHVFHLSTEDGLVSQLAGFVWLEDGARARLVEHHLGEDGRTHFANHATRIVLGGGASLVYGRLQQESARAFHIGALAVEQARDSRLEAVVLTAGARLSRLDIEVGLNGEGAETLLPGLYLGSGRQHLDHHLRVEHRAPRCRSRQFYRGVLDGVARGVYTGRVVVHAGAAGTDARQDNHNLLLSPRAEADSRPQLEIFNDDVKCAHGATVGQLDPEQVFYLKSRGVAETAARAMLARAFAGAVLERIGAARLRGLLQAILDARPVAGARP